MSAKGSRDLSSSIPLVVSLPSATHSGSAIRFSGNSSPRGILIPKLRSRRKTMSRKSMDSAPRSPWRVASWVTSSSSTPKASTKVDALGVDEDEVTHDATLQGDLGAESIDFLDIVFRLERNFGIKIPRGELFPENLMADPEWVADGKLTTKGIEELRSRLPFADLSKFENDPAVDKIGDLYTVDMLVQYVQSKLAA